MAMRGKKPKAEVIRLVTGSKSITEDAPRAVGKARPPVKLTGRPAALWRRYIVPAYWLADADAPKAHMWCVLHAEWEEDPAAFLSARISQLRALGSELGLDPASRVRLGTPVSRKPAAADDYFDWVKDMPHRGS